MPSKFPPATHLVLLVIMLLFLPSRADAYLDPGTGSFILQAAIAVALAGAVTLKHYWHRVRNMFRGSNRDESDLDLDD
jgi:hypothetical protein